MMFALVVGGLSGEAEEVFEGVMMLVAVALLTWMIIWMMAQKSIAKELESRVSSGMD